MDTEDSEAEESQLTDSEQGPETLEEEEYLPDVLFASSILFQPEPEDQEEWDEIMAIVTRLDTAAEEYWIARAEAATDREEARRYFHMAYEKEFDFAACSRKRARSY